MNYLTLVHHLHVITNMATKAYALGGELFSITAILWCLNMLATMIKNVYEAGYAAGTFYRQYLHQHMKWLAIHLIAFIVLIIQLTVEMAKTIYHNRRTIIGNINKIRNTIGSYFVYQEIQLVTEGTNSVYQ